MFEKKNPLEGLILLELIAQMAGDTSLYKAKEEDISSRLDTFKAQWESPDAYQTFLDSTHINEDYLKQVIEQHLVAEQYVYRNLGIPIKLNPSTSKKIPRLGAVKQRKGIHTLFKLTLRHVPNVR